MRSSGRVHTPSVAPESRRKRLTAQTRYMEFRLEKGKFQYMVLKLGELFLLGMRVLSACTEQNVFKHQYLDKQHPF